MSAELQIIEKDGGIVELSLNLNDQNSFGLAAFTELDRTLKLLASHDKIRVLILHSMKPDVFSQGLNLEEMSSASGELVDEFIHLFYENLKSIYLFPHPVICAMPGHAMGYGAMIAMTSDYRLMADRARIGLPEVKLGIRVPIFIARILQDIVGVVEADHHILEGGAYKAAEAKEIGLIDQIVSPEEMLSAARKVAQRFLKNSRSAMTASKRAIRHRMDHDAIIEMDARETIKTLNTPDAREGISAAVEKRRPVFS